MAKLTITPPSVGEKDSVAEPKVTTALKEVEKWANGEVGTNNIAAENVTEAMLTKALQEKLVTNVGLVYAASAVSLEGANGKFYAISGAGTTLTLPAPTANRMIGGVGTGSATVLKVTASSGKIYHGTKTAGVTTAEFPIAESFLVFANGTDWLVLSGQPKSTETYVLKVWTQAEAEASQTPSATRPALVSFSANTGLEIAGQPAGGAFGIIGAQYYMPPGTKWKATPVGGITTVTILL